MTPAAPIPVTVIGGFLGAGKTTLVNRLLRGDLPIRFAVLVNDFGEINIDADLIERHDGDTINLANGCVCCSIGDSLIATLLQLISRPDRPDHIVIEASGVADPMRIAEIAIADSASFRLDAVVVLLDAQAVRSQAADRYVGDLVGDQIAAADLLVLNKMDLLDTAARGEVRAWLDRRRGSSPVIEAVGADMGPPFNLPSQRRAVPASAFQAVEAHKNHDEIFESISLRSDQPVRRVALEQFGNALPETVLRAKGIVSLTGEGRVAVHRAGRRWSVEPLDPPAEAAASIRMVLIGRKGDFDASELQQLFEEMFDGREETASPGSARDAVGAIIQ